MKEYGIFNDESADYTENEAVEAGFYSLDEARTAIEERYNPDDCVHVHAIEEEEENDEQPIQ